MTKEVITRFQSAGDYIQHVKTCDIKSDWTYNHAKTSTQSNSWYGCDFDTAVKLASDGWQDGLVKLQNNMAVIRTQGRGKARSHEVAGDYPIVARAIVGVPDSMSRRIINDASRKPILDIYISPVMTSDGSADKMIILGAAIVDFIDACESVGYSVALTVCMAAKARNDDICGSVFPLKKAGEQLDLEKIVYFIAHPSFLRRLGFQDFSNKLMESELGRGMGHDTGDAFDYKMAESGSLMFLTDAYTVNSIASPIDAKAWVLAQVKRQRPELIDAIELAT